MYDFQFDKDKGYRGNYYAASGLTYGYSHQLARHLALEFSLGIGYLATEYRKYTTYEGDLIWTSSGRYHFMGPTKAKISLVWSLREGGGSYEVYAICGSFTSVRAVGAVSRNVISETCWMIIPSAE